MFKERKNKREDFSRQLETTLKREIAELKKNKDILELKNKLKSKISMDIFKSRVKTTEDLISEIELRKTNQTEKHKK